MANAEIVEFVKIKDTTFWHDMNGDGRVEEREKVRVKAGENFEKKASAHIQANPTYYLQCSEIAYKPKIAQGSLQKYFDHPRKTALITEVDSDIKKLQAMNNRPQIYTELLGDLRMIREELNYTRFRYPKVGEVPDGFIGIYDNFSSTMVVTSGAPTSLLIHEMDHALTANQRVKSWGIAIKLRDNFGHVHHIPKDPKLPNQKTAQTTFSFTLDFPKANAKKFKYDDVKAYEALLKTVEHGHPACFSNDGKKAALANEVRGYVTMCRYLLFKIGFTQQDFDQITGTSPQAKAKKADMENRLKAHLSGSNLNYRWANQLLLYYFGIGGSSGKDSLEVFVNNYYTRMKAPGFVDVEGCKHF